MSREGIIINSYFKDKTICVVGAAESIIGTKQEEYINSFDVVVRINYPYPINEELKKDIGDKTDIIYHHLGVQYIDGILRSRLLSEEIDVLQKHNVKWVICPYPIDFVVTNKPTKERLEYFNKENKDRILYDCVDENIYNKMTSEIKGTPNTGTIAIVDVINSDSKEVYATGFDFFRSKWIPDHKSWSNPTYWHDMESQINYLKTIYKNNSKFHVDKVLKNILEE